MSALQCNLLTALTVLCGFLGLGSGRYKTRLLIRSTDMKATVASMEIVGMHRWSWVLLLLLMGKVSMGSVICMASLAT